MASSGNFAVWNKLAGTLSNAAGVDTLYEHGNTSFRGNDGSGNNGFSPLTHHMTSGKWYFEVYLNGAPAGGWPGIGIIKADFITTAQKTTNFQNQNYTSKVIATNGNKNVFDQTSYATYGTSFSSGDIYNIAVDIDGGKIWWGKNNSYFNSGNPATGTNAGDTFTAGTEMAIFATVYNGASKCVINSGQDSTFNGAVTAGSNADGNGFGDFKYSPPSGYLALCSANLPMASEVNPSEDNEPKKFHDTIIYTGTGSTRSITSLNFQPDWVLIKNRDQTDSWLNQNSVSGVGKTHEWNDAGPYEDETDCITAFNSDGFSLGNDHKVNASTEKYVAYCWKKSADVGFDIVEYSGNGTTNNVSHSLGAEPDCIMMQLKSGTNWDSTMYFNSTNMGSTKGVFMTLNNGAQSSTYVSAVSSSTFTPTSSANTSTRTYVAYLFRSIVGFSKFGEFEGNGNADGPYIYTGFRPKHIFFKAIDATENWQIRDTARHSNTGSQTRIYWNSSAAEGTASTASPIDFMANGFKIRGSNTEINSNTIIYGAWGDTPYKYHTPHITNKD